MESTTSNPFSEMPNSLIRQLNGFRVEKTFPAQQDNQLSIDQLGRYRLILIGETHEKQVTKISELVSQIATRHADTLALFVEGQVKNAPYLNKMPEEIKNKITVLTWDTAEAKTQLEHFFSNIIDMTCLNISEGLLEYLKNPSIKNLESMCKQLQENVSQLDEQAWIKSIAEARPLLENCLQFKEEFPALLKRSASPQAINLLTLMQSFLSQLRELTYSLTLASQESRNAVMVDTLIDNIKTFKKTILIAGKLHLRGDSQGDNNIQKGLQQLERLRLDFEEDYSYVILTELEEIEKDSPSPTLEEEDSFPTPVAIPSEWLIEEAESISNAPVPKKESPTLAEVDTEELEEESEELDTSPSVSTSGSANAESEKVEDKLAKIERDRKNIKSRIKLIEKTSLSTITQSYAEIYNQLYEMITEKGKISTVDNILFLDLILTTLTKIIDLKIKAFDKKCFNS